MSSKNIVAFQGVHGAHSDLACRQAYPYMETLPLPAFSDILHAVEDGRADLCMIPIENSQAGRVSEIHNLLPKTSLYIVAEYFQRIEHCLAAPKGTKLKNIKNVYSHPQALMQCSKFIEKHKLISENYSNTAIAAKDIAASKDHTKAVICSRLAVELYGLEIIKENVENSDDNTTVFVAMAREPLDPDSIKGRILTSLLFTARNIPAALYKALGGFATNGVNLLKLESYIPGGTSKTAQFYINFEGSPAERPVQLALEELGFFCRKVKTLGVYPAAKERFE